MIESSVASSAQCTSSSTSTVGRGGSESSASSSRWISCGSAPAASASSSAGETCRRDRGSGRAAAGSRGRRRCRRTRGRRARARDEAGDERGLADPRLADDEHDAALSPRRGVSRFSQRCQCRVALEQLHGSTIDPPAAPEHSAFGQRERCSDFAGTRAGRKSSTPSRQIRTRKAGLPATRSMLRR